MDIAIHRKISTQWINITKTNCVLQWIVIYPVNSAIQLLNNWGQVDKSYYNKNYKIVTIYTFKNSVVVSKPTP